MLMGADMCQHGNTVTLNLKTSSHQSHTGKAYWRDWEIDSCIAPLVKALQDAGIDMLGSCCGHGQRDGSILLADGRELIVRKQGTETKGPTGLGDAIGCWLRA